MKKKVIDQQLSPFVMVEEVMEILQVGRSTAYHTMQQLNKELEAKGYVTHAGRVSRKYLMERLYI